jgi:hypothetical protein
MMYVDVPGIGEPSERNNMAYYQQHLLGAK